MNLEREVRSCEEAGADWLHVDVMDGHFVPNLTIGVPVESQLASIARIPLDVHLMISNPLVQLPWFLACKPAVVTVHWEALGRDGASAVDDAREVVRIVHEAGSKAGIALKPDTPVDVLAPTIDAWDMVLVMSVFPGFSGQSYIPESAERVGRVAALARAAGTAPLIQVDGGMNATTAAYVGAQGADVIVAGNGVFKADDRAAAIEGIRCSAERSRSAAKEA
jgi:ribulose-phosphate 3-epimerase